MLIGKKLLGETFFNTGMNYVEKDPEKNALRLLDWADKVVKNTQEKKYVDFVRNLFQENSVWKDYMISMLKDTHPNVRRKFFQNFIVHADFIGLELRRRAMKKYNCNIPWAILMDPTSACNLHCTGCWAGEYQLNNNLSLELLDRIINEAKEIGVRMYLFSGGEPLVRKKDIIKLCEKHNDCMFMAFTNGTLIDDDFVKEVVRVGNLTFAISVEGFEEETDFRRGKGTYRQVIAAMDRLKEAGCIYGFSACYHRKNTEAVASDEYIDLMINKGCRFGWYFTYVPVGSDSDVDFMATPDQRAYMGERVQEIRQEKPIFLIDFWNDAKYIEGCIAGGRHYLHINSAGQVEPCAFIHYSNINIRDCSVMEALQSPLFMQYRKHQPFNQNHMRPCPLIDNPHYLRQMVQDSKAFSTQINDDESVEELTAKLEPYAQAWQERVEGKPAVEKRAVNQ